MAMPPPLRPRVRTIVTVVKTHAMFRLLLCHSFVATPSWALLPLFCGLEAVAKNCCFGFYLGDPLHFSVKYLVPDSEASQNWCLGLSPTNVLLSRTELCKVERKGALASLLCPTLAAIFLRKDSLLTLLMENGERKRERHILLNVNLTFSRSPFTFARSSQYILLLIGYSFIFNYNIHHDAHY